MDHLYYVARSILNWDDETFWDTSLRFLFKQLDLHLEIQAKHAKQSPSAHKKQQNVTKGERKKLKMLSESEVKQWRMKNN